MIVAALKVTWIVPLWILTKGILRCMPDSHPWKKNFPLPHFAYGGTWLAHFFASLLWQFIVAAIEVLLTVGNPTPPSAYVVALMIAAQAPFALGCIYCLYRYEFKP